MSTPQTADQVQDAARQLIRCTGDTARAVVDGLTETSWGHLLEAVSPALYPYLDFRLTAARAIDAIPLNARRALARARRASIAADLQRRSVLRAALACLAANGIPAVLLKGAAVAHTVYPESHLRPMTDLDIWVTDAELTDAVHRLLEKGFNVPQGVLADGRVSPALDQRRLCAGSGVLLELHGSVRSLECVSSERLERCRTRLVPLWIHGFRTRMLCPEDALVHTCLHVAMTNRFAKSQLSLLDVCLLIEAHGADLDWDRMAADASREHIAVYLTLALTTARDVWGARIPEEFVAAIGEIPGLPAMQALALEQVWEPNPALPSALEKVLQQPTGAARLAAVLRRVLVYPWEASRGETRTPWKKARQAADRVKTDVTVKIPGYVRAWARGDLAAGELRRRARLAARRSRLGLLAGEAEERRRKASR